MRMIDIIIKKRDRGELSKDEIDYFIQGYNAGEIPDYQASAWAMAVIINGMTARETTDLTLAMVESGETLDVSEAVPLAVDKHSTGGVGDKTTLVVGPVVAACGLPVGKMSGRGLGFSGGTLDKLESIPGFEIELSVEAFLRQMREVGLVVSGQTRNLAPADGKLYALRDVTGTVPSIPLIASSIMCKKIAGGAQVIVLDVKWGKGAFMTTLDRARELAALMVDIARLSGRQAVGLISDMNQPLGHAVGNALEIREAVDALHGRGPRDLREHCLEVSAQMLVLGQKASGEACARAMAQEALDSGRAWAKFRALISAQGGDVSYVDHPGKLPVAPLIETVRAPRAGYLAEVNAALIGETSVHLGAGRAKKGDAIDHAVGLVVDHKVGDYVEAGAPLFTIHANDPALLSEAREAVLAAHLWSDHPAPPLPLFYGVVQ